MATQPTPAEPQLMRENADMFEEIKRLGWQLRLHKEKIGETWYWNGTLETDTVRYGQTGSTCWVVMQALCDRAAGLPVDISRLEAIYGKRKTYLSVGVSSAAPLPPSEDQATQSDPPLTSPQ